jgi:hypothetical protein
MRLRDLPFFLQDQAWCWIRVTDDTWIEFEKDEV